MNTPRKILIIRLSSLGDILHTLPAFQSLREAFPEARIDWVVEKRMKFLLSAVPGIDELLTINTRSLQQEPWNLVAWKELLRLIRSLRSKQYDFAIDFQGLIKTGFLGYLSGSKVRMGLCRELVRERPASWFYHQTLAKPAEPVHVIRLNKALAEAAGGLSTPVQFPPLNATEEDWCAIETRLQKEQLSQFVIVNPGGGWPTKRWKTTNYGELAGRIRKELDLGVVVTTGPKEKQLYEEICRHSTGSPPSHFPVPFLQLIPLCLKARLLVAGDTGPFHLACALGIPVVGIFGPTSPVRNGPISERDEVVVHARKFSSRNGRVTPAPKHCLDITVDEVFDAVVRRLRKEESASKDYLE